MVFFLFFLATTVHAAEAKYFQSGPEQAVLVELFTSEGCSSCPPAEEWMSGFKSSPGLWKRFVPVSFHVDYWNHPWEDRLSRETYTARQENYVSRWRARAPYTPMVVNDGRESRGWGRSALPKMDGKKQAGILEIEMKNPREFQITYSLPKEIFLEKISIHAAYLGCDIISRVERGENEGRTLRHDFAALSMEEKNLNSHDGIFKTSIRFSSQEPVPAPRHAIAVWVTKPESGEPLQAAGGFLDSPKGIS